MKLKNCSAAFAVAIAVGVVVAGCKGEPSILDQQAAAKKLPPPTAAMMKKGWDQIAANHAKEKQDELDWAAKNPDKVAQVNADRAKSGKPPLGQTSN